MPEHILLALAKRRPFSVTPVMPSDAYFDDASGRWLVAYGFYVDGSQVGPTTKKCDQETGEDQKGE
jgi:hypothetical protein